MRKINRFLEILKSEGGYLLFTAIAVFMLCIITTAFYSEYLLQTDTAKKAGFSYPVALCLGLMFSMVFEFFTFFTAINRHKYVSFFCALLSCIFARATFESGNEIEFTASYIAGWVMTCFPSFMIAFLSHQLAEKFIKHKPTFSDEIKEEEKAILDSLGGISDEKK